ncbi:MAG: hypothetical protein IT319_16105 [Anaerolineae bacterium]|nr:hypothetical protein [Anaerolineae bacterium]
MTTFMVQMAKPQWAEAALHLACAVARTSDADLILLRLIQPQHYSWLGTPFGFELSAKDSERVWRYKAIAASYGVELRLQSMQYVTLIGALVEAAEMYQAQAVFACIPESILPMWHQYQVWDLRRQLERLGCALHTLDQPAQAVVSARRFGTLRQHG